MIHNGPLLSLHMPRLSPHPLYRLAICSLSNPVPPYWISWVPDLGSHLKPACGRRILKTLLFSMTFYKCTVVLSMSVRLLMLRLSPPHLTLLKFFRNWCHVGCNIIWLLLTFRCHCKLQFYAANYVVVDIWFSYILNYVSSICTLNQLQLSTSLAALKAQLVFGLLVGKAS